MRILHTMLRVGDLGRAVDFYTGVLGMTLIRRTERPEQNYSLAFVGYGSEEHGAVLELTYNHGVDHYEPGTAFGHVAIEVDDAAAACGSRGGVCRDCYNFKFYSIAPSAPATRRSGAMLLPR